MKLTHPLRLSAKPQGRPYKLRDHDSMYLRVSVSGSKVWKFDYQLDGKDRSYTLGRFPDLSISDGRQRRNAAAKLVASGNHPKAHEPQLQLQTITHNKNTFCTAADNHLFPNVKDKSHPMAPTTINAALIRAGFNDEQLFRAHGARGTFSTRAHEQEFAPLAVERQLAHIEKIQVSRAYNKAEFLPERQKMMQDWGDYLQSLVRVGTTELPKTVEKQELRARVMRVPTGLGLHLIKKAPTSADIPVGAFGICSAGGWFI